MNWKDKVKTTFYSCDRFVRFVIQHFIQDDCTYIASALAFTSLLAVVPLMSVGLAIFSSFPVFQGLAERYRILFLTISFRPQVKLCKAIYSSLPLKYQNSQFGV